MENNCFYDEINAQAFCCRQTQTPCKVNKNNKFIKSRNIRLNNRTELKFPDIK